VASKLCLSVPQNYFYEISNKSDTATDRTRNEVFSITLAQIEKEDS
jgi:hypothetical protein